MPANLESLADWRRDRTRNRRCYGGKSERRSGRAICPRPLLGMWPWVLGLVPGSGAVLQGPSADSAKAYWSARKAFYETSVREPMAGLLDELSGHCGALSARFASTDHPDEEGQVTIAVRPGRSSTVAGAWAPRRWKRSSPTAAPGLR